jgi:hypothetical protein
VSQVLQASRPSVGVSIIAEWNVPRFGSLTPVSPTTLAVS